MPDRVHIRLADDCAPYPRRVAARLAASAGEPALQPLFAQLTTPLLARFGAGEERAGIRAEGDALIVGDGWDLSDADVPQGDAARAFETLLAGPARSWRELAHAFWAATAHRPGTPAAVRLLCTSEGEDAGELILGDAAAAPGFELHGTAADLSAYLRGDVPLAPAVLSGESLGAQGPLAVLSVMQGNGLATVLGRDV